MALVRKIKRGYPRRIKGRGDYQIGGSSVQHIGSNDPPSFSAKNNEVVVTHREYIQDIVSNNSPTGTNIVPTGTAGAGFPINPGCPFTFPWLSTIATQFQQYRIIGCVFEYRSLSGEFSNTTTTALGSVALGTDYNSVNVAWNTRYQVLNSEFHVDGKPTEDLIHPIECSKNQTATNLLYVGNGTAPAASDPRLYNMGLMQVFTAGMPSASGTVGELYVSYKVALYKPIINPGFSPASQFGVHYNLVAPVVTTAYFGTSQSLPTGNVDSIGVTFPSNTAFRMASGNQGTWMAIYTVAGVAATVVAPTWTNTINCTFLPMNVWASTSAFGAVSNPIATFTAATSTELISIQGFNITNSSLPTTITLSVGTLPGATAWGDLFLIKMPVSIVG